MDKDREKHLLLPLVRMDALSVRGVTTFTLPGEGNASTDEDQQGVWLWINADARPDLGQFWMLHARAGGGTSEIWWLSDLDEEVASPCLYLICRLHLASSAEALFFLRFPLPDLLWVLEIIEKATVVGLAIAAIPSALSCEGRWPHPVRVINLPQVLRNGVVLSELSKENLRGYLHSWHASSRMQEGHEQSS